MKQCPKCGFDLKLLAQKRRVSRLDKEEFVKSYETLIRNEGVSFAVIQLARRRLGYAPSTVSLDIASGLMKVYRRLFECRVCGDHVQDCRCDTK